MQEGPRGSGRVGLLFLLHLDDNVTPRRGEGKLGAGNEDPGTLERARTRILSLAVGADDDAVELSAVLLDELVDRDEGGSTGTVADRRLLLPLLPFEGVLLIDSEVERVELEGDLLGQAAKHGVDLLQLVITHRTRHVDEDGDRRGVGPMDTGVDVRVLPVDAPESVGLVEALARPDEVPEELLPVDRVLDHATQVLAHLGGDRTPLAVAVALPDRVAQGLLHASLSDGTFLVGHLAPPLVVVELADALAAGPGDRLLVLGVLHEAGEVPLHGLTEGETDDLVRDLLPLDQLRRVGDPREVQGTPGPEANLRHLVFGNEGVDREVTSEVSDRVRREAPGGAVVEDEVVGLMLQDTEVLLSVQRRHEPGAVVEVELAVLDTHTCGGHVLLADLRDAAHDLGEEGFRQEHVDQVRLDVIPSRDIRRGLVPRDSRRVLVICHQTSLPGGLAIIQLGPDLARDTLMSDMVDAVTGHEEAFTRDSAQDLHGTRDRSVAARRADTTSCHLIDPALDERDSSIRRSKT